MNRSDESKRGLSQTAQGASFPKNKRNEMNISKEAKILIGMPVLRAFHV